MTQHAVMKISLKSGMPKVVLASIIMYKGCEFKFQVMGIVFQHDWLKKHIQRKGENWFLHNLNFITHNNKSSRTLFSFSKGSLYWVYLRWEVRRKTYYPSCLRTITKEIEGRLQQFQSAQSRLFCYCNELSPRNNSKHQTPLHPAAFLGWWTELPLISW